MTLAHLIRRTRARATVQALEQALDAARRELARLEEDEQETAA